MNHLVERIEKRRKELPALIEQKRKQMIAIGMEKGFTAKETVQCSQELDVILNEYTYINQEID